MKAKHARDIRQGILTARRIPTNRGPILLNSRHYSELAVRAFNAYRRRHGVIAETGQAWEAFKTNYRTEFPNSTGPVLGRAAFMAGWAAREARDHTQDDEGNCWIDGEGWPCRFAGSEED